MGFPAEHGQLMMNLKPFDEQVQYKCLNYISREKKPCSLLLSVHQNSICNANNLTYTNNYNIHRYKQYKQNECEEWQSEMTRVEKSTRLHSGLYLLLLLFSKGIISQAGRFCIFPSSSMTIMYHFLFSVRCSSAL